MQVFKVCRAGDQNITSAKITLHHFPIGGRIGGENTVADHRPDNAKYQAIDMLMRYQSDDAGTCRNVVLPQGVLNPYFGLYLGQRFMNRFGCSGRP